jgi:hypothetical protein
VSTVRVSPYSTVHTVAHVATNMLNFLKEIIRGYPKTFLAIGTYCQSC